MSTILVTGGTGALGREVVTRLTANGQPVRLMSRKPAPHPSDPRITWAQADLETGAGVADAIHGATTIIHCASNAANSYQSDVMGTGALLDAARSARVTHFVHISIVGIERIPFAYYRHKVQAEQCVIDSGVPYSILRATQFHTLADLVLRGIAARRRLLIWPLPTDFKFQLIDPGEVADALIHVAADEPAGRLPDLGGPQTLTSGEIARMWLHARGIRRPVVPVPFFGGLAKGFRVGYNTTPNIGGTITWSEYLQRTCGTETSAHPSKLGAVI